MKNTIYIVLFISGIAFAQDSIARGSIPNADFIKSLQNQVPGGLQINTGGQNYPNPYQLTQADKDSLYAAAFNGQIVQQAIKAKFKGKSKLFERGYEMELLSLLTSDSISNDINKNLLTRRILADAEYNRVNNITADRKMPCYQNGIDKSTAIAMYKCLGITDFTGCIYVVDGLMYIVSTTEGMQSMFSKLQKTDIATIEIVRGDELKNTTFCSYPPNVIIITGAKH